MKCSIQDCVKPAHCKTFCVKHYRSLRAHGDPLAARTNIPRTPVLPSEKATRAIWHDADECPTCFGRGFEKWYRTLIGDAEFELGYLNKMATLPNVQIHTRGPSEPMTLRFDGGEALLAPMVPREAGS